MSQWPFDPRVRELLRLFLKMARKVKKPYAIGGALAMDAHGYRRQTSDVDAFLLLEDRVAWMRAAKEVGLTTDRVFSQVHYIAFLPAHGDPRIRIDMLFPAAEPELSAVEYPVQATIGDVRGVQIFSPELLALAKFTSDRAEDRADFDAMLERGLFDVAHARAMLAAVDKAEADSLGAHVAKFAKRNAPARRGR